MELFPIYKNIIFSYKIAKDDLEHVGEILTVVVN